MILEFIINNLYLILILLLTITQIIALFFGKGETVQKIEKQKQKYLVKLRKQHEKRGRRFLEEENEIKNIEKELKKNDNTSI